MDFLVLDNVFLEKKIKNRVEAITKQHKLKTLKYSK
jgi:hypothetical protein